MGLAARPTNPALAAVARSLEAKREILIAQWADWLMGRMSQDPIIDRPTIERQLALLLDIVIELTGPLRRQIEELWFDACDAYGRTAAARGLAAGEVVEEIQHLRELLIHHLADVIAALPARQLMAAVLRLNRALDRGIAHAVVGYTDVLVETLMEKGGVALTASGPGNNPVHQRLGLLEEELNTFKQIHR